MNLLPRLISAASAGIVALGPNLSFGARLPESVRVYFSETCIVADEPVVSEELAGLKMPGLSTIIATNTGQALLGSLIRGIARLIGKTSSTREVVYAVDKDMYLYSVNLNESPEPRLTSELGCMTVVAGHFQANGRACTERYEPAYLDGDRFNESTIDELRSNRDPANVLRRANVCVEGTPSLLLESRIEKSDDGTAFRLKGAGLQVNSLLTSRRDRDRRALLLTLSMFQPSKDGRGEHLATSWINYGTLTSGVQIPESLDRARSAWTATPGMSPAAAAVHRTETEDHAIAGAEAAHLERSILRLSRQLSTLEAEADTADPRLRPAYQKEVDRLNIEIAVQHAELAAWRAEYDELPIGQRQYMPATVRVSLLEARSERQGLGRVADLLETYSEEIATDLALITYRD